MQHSQKNFKKQNQKQNANQKNVKLPEKAPKICSECAGVGKYKCPKCLVLYCQVECYKKHTATCVPKLKKKQKHIIYPEVLEEDTIGENKLEKVKKYLKKNEIFFDAVLVGNFLQNLAP